MDLGIKLSRKQFLAIAVVVIIALPAAYFVLNYDTRVVVTGSMAGNVHPEFYSECSHGHQCIGEVSTCSECGSPMTSSHLKIGGIYVHDAVIIKTMKSSEMGSIHVGDVISFYNHYTHLQTVHRVINFHYNTNGDVDGFYTKGDNASADSSPAMFSDVEGVVVAVSSAIGHFVNFIQSSTILFLLIIVILGVMVSVVWDMIKMYRGDKKLKQ